MNSPICERLENLHGRIRQICDACGRDPSEITLIAVSKTRSVEEIETALACGQVHFGENRARELEEKMQVLEESSPIWHFVGPMQTNKIKYMTDRVHWIHSVYKKKYLKEIEKRAKRDGRTINILIQINISREKQKQGCEPKELKALLEYAANLSHVKVCGLMGMATHTDDREEIRREFRLLRETLEQHRSLNGKAVELEHLSMGMSHDFDIAIEEGSTILRVGTAIFGERDYE